MVGFTGVSQADHYQMYTYAGNYDVDNVTLIYPLQSYLSHLDRTWKFADRKNSVSILQIDLETIILNSAVEFDLF
jgi:5-methylcytosine-specific restriction endonuclease McrBC regulatory subunit McrC